MAFISRSFLAAALIRLLDRDRMAPTVPVSALHGNVVINDLISIHSFSEMFKDRELLTPSVIISHSVLA
jgi:hypothetical protein